MIETDAAVFTKIRKIQALADRASTQGEAQAALNALQNMLSKHNLSLSEIPDEKQAQEDLNTIVVDEDGKKQHWKGWLGMVIAENFRCEVYWGYPAKLNFIGLESEVFLAKTAFQSAVLALMRFKTQHLYDRRMGAKVQGIPLSKASSKAAGKSFIAGFITGLQESFAENVKANSLILLKDARVTDAKDSLALRKVHSQARYSGDAYSRTAGHAAGLSHGRDQRSGKLDAGFRELSA